MGDREAGPGEGGGVAGGPSENTAAEEKDFSAAPDNEHPQCARCGAHALKPFGDGKGAYFCDPDLKGCAQESVPAEGFQLTPKQRFRLTELVIQGEDLDDLLAKEGIPTEHWADAKREVRAHGAVEVKAAQMTFEDAVKHLKVILYLRQERDYVVILYWAAQSHLIEALSRVFYLAFSGGTGSGKSTGVETAILLANDGLVLSESTPAYLKRVLDEGKAVGLTEMGSLPREDPKTRMLRNGYRRETGTTGFMDKDGKGRWIPVEVNVYGPKAFDFVAGLDDHIRGRTYEIEMVPDDSVDRVFDADEKVETLAPLRAWLAREAQRALEAWDEERIKALYKTPEFRQRVADLGGAFARDHELAKVLLTINDVMGWDAEDQLGAVVKDRIRLDEYGLPMEVLETIKDLEPPSGWESDDRLPVSDLLAAYNERRRNVNLRPIAHKTLAGGLKDLGVRRPEEWFKAKDEPNRDLVVIRPAPILEKRSQPSQPSQQQEKLNGRDGTDGTDGTDSQASRQGKADLVPAFIESVRARSEAGKGAPRTLVYQDLEAAGASSADALAVEADLKRRGKLYEPTTTRLGVSE